ncbi:MAG: hypothetical protein L6R40_008588 [Gallowayella cf. fulva]|nr:MAG: hypothetical protein L6R40_008588 [Xanthomendoza cf. fulva]
MADQEDEVKLEPEAAEDQEVQVKPEELRTEYASPEAPLHLVHPTTRRARRIRWPDAPILDNGVNPTFEDWAWHIRVKCQKDYPVTRDQINYACIRTTGVAAACLRPRRAIIVDLDDLIDHISFLGDPDPRQTASNKLYSLVQEEDEAFATFWPKFATLIVELDYPEWAKVDQLSGKLNLRLRKVWDLQVPRPATLLAARAFLHQVDANQRATEELFALRAEKPTEKPPSAPQFHAKCLGPTPADSPSSRSKSVAPAPPNPPISLGSINAIEIVDETPLNQPLDSRQSHHCRRCPEKFSSNTKLHQHITAHHKNQAEQRIKALEQENKEKTQAWAAEKAALQAQVAAVSRQSSPPAHRIRVVLPPSPPVSTPPSPPPPACTVPIPREFSVTVPASPARNGRSHEKFSWNKRPASMTIHQLFKKFGSSWLGTCSVRFGPIRFHYSNGQIPARLSANRSGQLGASNTNRVSLRISRTAALPPRPTITEKPA